MFKMKFEKITPEEYGRLSAYALELYHQKKPFEKYTLKPFSETNKIEYYHYLASNMSYAQFRIYLELSLVNKK